MKEILSPFEFLCWQIVGYGVFAIAWIFIPIAILHGIAELRPRAIKRPMRSLRKPIPFPARACRVLVFPITRKAAPDA